MSRRREDGIADRRRHRRKRRLAHSRWSEVALDEMHIDLRRGRHSQHRIAIEIRLGDAPVLDGELQAHRGAEAIDHAAFHLILRATQVDDGSDVTRNRHALDDELAIFIDAYLRHFREVTRMTEVEREAEALPL